MSDFDKNSFFSLKILPMFILCFGMLFSVLTWAETATATDETSEAVVVGKIIKDQQQTAQNSNTTPTAPEIKIQVPTVANDMAEGESIRGLPTLNEPVVGTITTPIWAFPVSCKARIFWPMACLSSLLKICA